MRVPVKVQHGHILVLGRFKDYYSDLAGNILKRLLEPSNEFLLTTVNQYYKTITKGLLILLLFPKTQS